MIIFEMASPERRQQWQRPETGGSGPGAAMAVPAVSVTCSF